MTSGEETERCLLPPSPPTTKAANTSETSLKFYQTTWRNNPEDSHLHSHRPENIKPQNKKTFWFHKMQIIFAQLSY
jgi:hypothetical protein